MIIPFIALIAIIALVIYFFVFAGKKKIKVKDLGDPGQKYKVPCFNLSKEG